MAEAEDVITDAARHATIYARELWLRRRGHADKPKPVILAEVAERLDLLVTAIFGTRLPPRVAQPPAIPSFMHRIFRRHDVVQSRLAVPTTDGRSIWLPNDVQTTDRELALERFRVMGLLHAMRVQRGSARHIKAADPPLTRALYIVLEAYACDEALAAMLPGTARAIVQLRAWALSQRPAVARLPFACRPVEQWVQAILHQPLGKPLDGIPLCKDAAQSHAHALALAQHLQDQHASNTLPHTHALFKDCWTGDLIPASEPDGELMEAPSGDAEDEDTKRPNSAHMPRRPKERKANENEDDTQQGVWMVQTNDPLEQAEDPMGMQRPADRDETTAPEEFADALSELPEARLVSTPTRPKEVLLSDDPTEKRSLAEGRPQPAATQLLRYPEWDYRINGYHHPGATVHLLQPALGTQVWIDRTLARHKTLLDTIRKRFEMLRADRVWLRRQLDGDDIDLDACTEAAADLRAGLPLRQALYRQQRPESRDMAITLLIDISGSTDSWLSENRRIIDVEREALLLVAIALERMGSPYSILAFSGEGPQGVTVATIKDFAEPYSNQIALRIAALEPQHYTRAGAALRHASTLLMQHAAKHRLLLLLSDGKPNDVDLYEGRYGVEDMRRAVTEARMQGIFPFCLTIDRLAAKYLPAVFGARQYALLSKPESLPTVLLDWMKRLVST